MANPAEATLAWPGFCVPALVTLPPVWGISYRRISMTRDATAVSRRSVLAGLGTAGTRPSPGRSGVAAL